MLKRGLVGVTVLTGGDRILIWEVIFLSPTRYLPPPSSTDGGHEEIYKIGSSYLEVTRIGNIKDENVKLSNESDLYTFY